MTRAEMLASASRIVTRDRNSQYGEPEDLFAAVALAWDALDAARGSRARDARDVALYLDALKSVRASANPGHLDSWIDKCGYSACGGEIAARVSDVTGPAVLPVVHNVAPAEAAPVSEPAPAAVEAGALWTEAEDAVLLEMHEQDADDHAIAERLGRSRAAVSSRRFKMRARGIIGCRAPKSVWSTEDIVTLIEMRHAGKTWAEISARLGRGEGTCRWRWSNLPDWARALRENPGADVAAAIRKAAERRREENPVRRGWMDSEIDDLIAMRGKGLTLVDIAPRLGRSVRACQAMSKRLIAQGRLDKGFAGVRWSDADDRQLDELRDAGLTHGEIAERMGRTVYSVQARTQTRARRAGIAPHRHEAWTAAEDATLLALRKDGVPWREVAERLGRTEDACMFRGKVLKKEAAAQEQRAKPIEVDAPAAARKQEAGPGPEHVDPDKAAPGHVGPVNAAPDRGKPPKATLKRPEPTKAALTQVDPTTVSVGAEAPQKLRDFVDHLDSLGDEFAPADDLDVLEGLYVGRRLEAIADDLGCQPKDVRTRWVRMRRPWAGQDGSINAEDQRNLFAAARWRMEHRT